MAVIPADELTSIRRLYAAENTVAFSKITYNLAVQAIEDWWIANQASLSVAIDTATSPTTMTNAQKRQIVKFWLLNKFGRGN